MPPTIIYNVLELSRFQHIIFKLFTMFSPRRATYFLMFFYCIFVSNGGEIKGYDSPMQCNNIDCPKYDVIHSEKEFEIRSYTQALIYGLAIPQLYRNYSWLVMAMLYKSKSFSNFI